MRKSHKQKVKSRHYKKLCFYFGKVLNEEIKKELDNELIHMIRSLSNSTP